MTNMETLEKSVFVTFNFISKVKVDYDLLYGYKDAFSFRDEIYHCPNIKVYTEVIEQSPSFIKPFHVTKEDKPFIEKEMQRYI